MTETRPFPQLLDSAEQQALLTRAREVLLRHFGVSDEGILEPIIRAMVEFATDTQPVAGGGEHFADAGKPFDRAAVLEEAARVADHLSDQWNAEWRADHKTNSHLEGKADGAFEIAAAIRQLSSPDEGVAVQVRSSR